MWLFYYSRNCYTKMSSYIIWSPICGPALSKRVTCLVSPNFFRKQSELTANIPSFIPTLLLSKLILCLSHGFDQQVSTLIVTFYSRIRSRCTNWKVQISVMRYSAVIPTGPQSGKWLNVIPDWLNTVHLKFWKKRQEIKKFQETNKKSTEQKQKKWPCDVNGFMFGVINFLFFC